MRLLYWMAVTPAAGLHAALLWLRARARGEPLLPPLAQRFGFAAPIAGRPVWIHAASVGEVQLATTLVRALRMHYPDLPLLVTAFTPTGAARAAALAPEVTVRALPYDLPGPVRRFLARSEPRLAIVLETELWPTLFESCRRRGIPLVIANARLSERTARRYRRFGALFAPALRTAVIAARSAEDAERFRSIGADAALTHVTGNLKFDYTRPPDLDARARALRARYAEGRPLWVAGSTHQGEDSQVIAAHARVRALLPESVLVLAPRHPQRFESVAAELGAQGVSYVRHSRSSDPAAAAKAAVVLLDTLGELQDFYAAADAAFVGGSLVPIGGHNLLEPAALGRPVASGPSDFNAAEIARLLLECGAARRVHDEQELGACMLEWLRDPHERARVGELGRAAVESHRGALGRLLELIGPQLGPPAA
ncbi:MAG: 3-deoxy-D-manno-octulosonic acid transferase [Steroidobacteraceae bacterium]